MSIKRDTVEQRKALPLASGVLDYFPDALLVVAEVSRVGNEQHHPGQPLHWDKSKSTDEADALLRHLVDRGTRDTDGLRHSGKVAWRALAMLQRELDAEAAEAGKTEAIFALNELASLIPWRPESRCAYCAEPQGSGHAPMCPLRRPPIGAPFKGVLGDDGSGFKGYGGTGDPSTRSVHENAVHGALLPEEQCPLCGRVRAHMLDCPARP